MVARWLDSREKQATAPTGCSLSGVWVLEVLKVGITDHRASSGDLFIRDKFGFVNNYTNVILQFPFRFKFVFALLTGQRYPLAQLEFSIWCPAEQTSLFWVDVGRKAESLCKSREWPHSV